MLTTLRRLLGSSGAVRNRVVAVYAFLLVFNLVAWALAIASSTAYPIMLPTAFLAYTFGLRHAVDADHIAAIDNSTRKLMQDGERPVAVRALLLLGHSTIVVGLTVLVAISAGSSATSRPPTGRWPDRDRRLRDVPAGYRDHQTSSSCSTSIGCSGRSPRAGRTTRRASRTSSTTGACSRGSSGRCSG